MKMPESGQKSRKVRASLDANEEKLNHFDGFKIAEFLGGERF
jgi:hypothetical protein